VTEFHDHERWRDEVAAYALDALPGAERNALESHLSECEECRAYLRWLRPAEAAVATSVEQIKPPRRLRRALLANVRKEEPSRPRWFLARPVVATALAVTIAAALAGGYVLRGSGPSTETVTAEATGAAPADLAARLVREGDSGTLELTGLRLPKGGRVYEAWVRRGSEISPSTVFVPDRAGAATVALPNQLADADEVMVTREPAGGSNAPTTAPMLHVPLRQS
jgi:Anti-sigma-K factor rskA/Putative zinc-finger